MAATTTSPLTADKPRGKNRQARWYATHARPAETLFMIELPNGRMGKHNGAVAVSSRRDVLETLVARLGRASLADVSTYKVRAWAFQEGTAVTRLESFADVDRIL